MSGVSEAAAAATAAASDDDLPLRVESANGARVEEEYGSLVEVIVGDNLESYG